MLVCNLIIALLLLPESYGSITTYNYCMISTDDFKMTTYTIISRPATQILRIVFFITEVVQYSRFNVLQSFWFYKLAVHTVNCARKLILWLANFRRYEIQSLDQTSSLGRRPKIRRRVYPGWAVASDPTSLGTSGHWLRHCTSADY